ncbi:MAG: putative histidine kinase, hybrid, partial [Verrucomicrobiaceae bacterium]|nr:putative histidine kinase, hybrid [Verrucomicrobiaceae bacterium]
NTAIGTGMVDWILKVGEMPSAIEVYVDRRHQLILPPEEGAQPASEAPSKADEHEENLRNVLAYLRTSTGRDFSYYKRATILRRIARRMQVNGVVDLSQYLKYLRTHSGEAGALLQDLLISVTNFFRDGDCFEALAARIPDLFKGKTSADTVRVWTAACATGEEAYSMAILLSEHARTLESPPILQVFATDLDAEAIKVARTGFYLPTISADVRESWLSKYFVKEPHGFRVKREVREIVLFAVHDLLRDSPFCHLDLVSCRNLLIYLTKDAQRRALDIFHFALRSEGRLFLGSCESTDESAQFEVLDKKNRIYVRRGLPDQHGLPLAIVRSFRSYIRGEGLPGADRPAVAGANGHPQAPLNFVIPGRDSKEQRPLSWGELHYKMLEQVSPPSILVTRDQEMLHLSENVGKFLQLSGGEPTRNLLRAIHPMLRIELRTAFNEALQSGQPAKVADVPFEFEGAAKLLNITVSPARDIDPALLVVVFDMRDSAVAALPPEAARKEPEPLARQLEREIEGMRANLKGVVEQYEISTEELKASNEELQSMNEELRSATEELETNREELHSINEELVTVNLELKSNVDELGNSNGDLRNLIGATAIATVFLDRDLCITRYTPTAVSLFNLIPTDIGRPLSDLKHRLDYPELELDARHVIETLKSSEREICDSTQHWYIARMLPYRTLDDRIAGVVITFLEITARKLAEERLRTSEERLRLVLESAHDHAIFTLDLDRKVTSWNSGAQRMLGYEEQEIVGSSADVIFTGGDREKGIPEQEAAQALADGRASDERWYVRKDGRTFWASGGLMKMRSSTDEAVGFVKIFRDHTDFLNVKNALEASHLEAQAASLAKDRFLAVLSHELRTPLTPISVATMIIEDEPDLSSDAKEAVALIKRNVDMECRLIDDLLDITRIVRGSIYIVKATVDMHEIIHVAAETCEESMAVKNQELVMALEAANHGLMGDSMRLRQVLWNLLKNASKFTPHGGAIKVRTFNRQRLLVIEVSDNGIGIPAAALPSIFESFAQGDPSTAARFGGLGLGLAIAKAIVEAHGGTIHAVSAGTGRGATISVELPLD